MYNEPCRCPSSQSAWTQCLHSMVKAGCTHYTLKVKNSELLIDLLGYKEYGSFLYIFLVLIPKLTSSADNQIHTETN